MDPALIAAQLEQNHDLYTFWVPEARWSTIRHLKTNVGSALNKALADHNHEALQDVLKHINFSRKIGQRTLDDDVLSNFVQNFEKIPLRDENFEFPDLRRRPRIADQMVRRFSRKEGRRVLHPRRSRPRPRRNRRSQPHMSVYDPTVGSSGMLIQTGDYVAECGGDPRDLSLARQDSIGTTWSICKMNMRLLGIPHADIRQEDTIRRPQHKDDNGELRRFHRVLANPPFSQNYARKDVEYPGRFAVWMPEKGKKADLMFVQPMLAVLRHDGRMATIMLHGVLFRAGEEKEARKYFLKQGWLDAVIGLPAGLFYGTGIPACVLVMSKQGAQTRRDVLFINADREYREGKAQNFLRPEDISKVVHAYPERRDISDYARVIPVSEIEAEDFNCNIRRYVDNASPPEPHDVRAHLHGGVPVAEIDAPGHFWRNDPGLRERVFVPRPPVDGSPAAYGDFAPAVMDRRAIAATVKADPGVAAAHTRFLETLGSWWTAHVAEIEGLAPTNGGNGNVYTLRRRLLASTADAFAASPGACCWSTSRSDHC
jgi:type I restriction enzyme M protein